MLLLGRPASIGPARVAVVDAAGPVRTVSLPGIAAGFQEPADWDVLRSLEVAWHRTEPQPGLLHRAPARAAAPAGRLAAARRRGQVRPRAGAHGDLAGDQDPSPHERGGLGRGRLPAFGRLLGPPADPDADEPTQRTYGLTVFGPGDRRPVHLFGTRQVNWVEVNGDRAYVALTPSTDRYVGQGPQAPDRAVAVVDLRRARVLAEWRGRLPELLGGTCCVEQAGW